MVLQKKRGDLTTAMTLCEKNSVLLGANVCICLHQEAGPICQRLNYIVVARGWGILGHLWTIFIFMEILKVRAVALVRTNIQAKMSKQFWINTKPMQYPPSVYNRDDPVSRVP